MPKRTPLAEAVSTIDRACELPTHDAIRLLDTYFRTSTTEFKEVLTLALIHRAVATHRITSITEAKPSSHPVATSEAARSRLRCEISVA